MRAFFFLICTALLDGVLLQTAPFNCNSNLDVVVVADASQSVAGSFSTIQNAVNAFITEVANNNPNIRIGLVFFNNGVETQPLQNPAGNFLQSWVSSRSGGTGATLTHLGIQTAQSLLNSRTPQNDASIVVITDAISQQPTSTLAAASNARNSGYDLFAIGVNVGDTYEQELFDITNDGGRIFTLSNVTEITDTVVQLARSLCAYTVCSGCLADFGTRRAAHPTRCDKFYMCERRLNVPMRAYEKVCPVGQLWHAKFSTCVTSDIALQDPDNSGCAYCQGTDTTFPVGDYCEVYYSCGGTSSADFVLNTNCCPAGFSYNDALGGCSFDSTCAARRYEDPASCRGYYFCDRTTTPTWTRDCCNGQRYNVTDQVCFNDNNCIGTCNSSSWRPCDNLSSHRFGDPCQFTVSIGTTFIDMACPGSTSFDTSVCGCVFDPNTCPPTTPAPTCDPDVIVPFTSTQSEPWGFSELSANQRWIGTYRLDYTNNYAAVSDASFLAVPYFSNNDQALTSNTVLFRVSVREASGSSGEMAVLDNTPCSNTISEAGTEASISITINPTNPFGPSATFRVRTTNGSAELTLQYNQVPGAWKELTLRYTQTPGLLEAGLRQYTTNAFGQPNFIGSPVQGSENQIFGRILTSDCSLLVGQRPSNSQLAFNGDIDSILFYDDCKVGAPIAVTGNSPTTLYN